eukprot:7748314-Ditylum_brightwellii.AAC.1
MVHNRKNCWSTVPDDNEEEEHTGAFPQQEASTNAIFICLGLVDHYGNVIYTNLTSKFLVIMKTPLPENTVQLTNVQGSTTKLKRIAANVGIEC